MASSKEYLEFVLEQLSELDDVVDIYMGKLTGIDLARKIRSRDEEVRIVFCSSSNEFAAESYELNASYYIRKPVSSRQYRETKNCNGVLGKA